MAHYAYLNGCPSREAAARHLVDDVLIRRDAPLEARYTIPLFWLAGFESRDLMAVSAQSGEEHTVLCAPVQDVVTRLLRRRDLVTRALPGTWGAFFDEWIRFVSAGYTSHLLVRTYDLFSMDDVTQSATRLRAAMRWLDEADVKGKLRETAAIDWFAHFSGFNRERYIGESPRDAAIRWRTHLAGYASVEHERYDWPSLPTAEEIAFAASVPEAPLPAEPGTTAAEAQRLTSIVRQGIHADTASGRMAIAVGKLAGDIPLGADAPSIAARKWLGGGEQLLEVLRGGFLALLCVPLGGLMLFFGCCDAHQWKLDALGGGLLAVGVWGGRSGWRAFRHLKTIWRA